MIRNRLEKLEERMNRTDGANIARQIQRAMGVVMFSPIAYDAAVLANARYPNQNESTPTEVETEAAIHVLENLLAPETPARSLL